MRVSHARGGARSAEILGGWVVLGAIAVLTARIDPSKPGRYPTCPVHALTGLDCPGCGSLRAMHDLALGDLPSALDHNALLVVVLLVAAVSSVRVLRGPGARRSPRGPWTGRAVVAGLVLWTLVRNLPLAPFSALAA